jgi:hypothetical protein
MGGGAQAIMIQQRPNHFGDTLHTFLAVLDIIQAAAQRVTGIMADDDGIPLCEISHLTQPYRGKACHRRQEN